MIVFTVEDLATHFDLLEGTIGVLQDSEHHPEGDVFTHSIQTMNWAFRETDDTDLILAAMLHDVGKKERREGHEKIAAGWLREEVSGKTLWLIENHMRIRLYLKGDMKKLSKCMDLAGHPWLPELIQLTRWDKMGRVPGRGVHYSRDHVVERLNKKVPHHFKGELWESLPK